MDDRQQSAGESRFTRRDFLAAVATGGTASLLAGCAGSAASVTSRPRFDLLVAGGTVLDGTGADGRAADVGIRDGRIAAVGRLADATAVRAIDAAGLLVVPGFIDIHAHVDLSLLERPKAESKVRQGVTTEVTGCDGDSVAPLGGPDLERALASFREDLGFDCPYRDMDGFFTLLQGRGCAPNVASLVGLGTLRGVVVGPDNRPATPDEIRAMQRLAREAVEQGCFGASTGLEYTPGSFASARELAEVMKGVPEPFRLYATHMRNEDDTLLEALEEAITIARDSGARLQVSHFKASKRANWGKQGRALEMLDEARAAGVDARADRYPYLAYATDLAALFPLWAREGGAERFLARLRDEEALQRMRPDVDRKIRGLGSWDAVLISSLRGAQNASSLGRTVQQISGDTGADPFRICVDLLLSEEARVGMVGFGMDEAGTEMVLAWKHCMVASDGGAYSPAQTDVRPHPRCYGTFPRAIAHYQRERNVTTLPDMIRRMTSLPAETLGLKDRGRIAGGLAADLVVFDQARVGDRATYVDPHQFPEGIPFVIVNGTVVVDGSRQTEALPGRVLRSSTAA